MKNVVKLLFFLTFNILFFACSSPSKVEKKGLTLEELLIKTWELHQAVGKNSKSGTESNELYHDKYIEFKKDKTYTTNAKYFKKEDGVWQFNELRDSIYLNKDTDKQIVFSIFNIYEKGMSLLSHETESEEDWQGQFYSLQFVEVGYYGSTQIPKDKR
ncbi:lipocalin family protein [Bernardetia sp. ABR2-2B]|uniref:lipocalin family protein n=1 Tax=Bernardetia sp. ABR2-2B TaxID=3127472 RepID=UPI0030D29654